MKHTALILLAVLALAGCRHVEQINLDEGKPAYGEGMPLAHGPFEGVDVLVVVDDSGSMSEEQHTRSWT